MTLWIASINLANVYAEIRPNFSNPLHYHLHSFAFPIVAIVLLILLSETLLLQIQSSLALTYATPVFNYSFLIFSWNIVGHKLFLLHCMRSFLLHLWIIFLVLLVHYTSSKKSNDSSSISWSSTFILISFPLHHNFFRYCRTFCGKSKAVNTADTSIITFRGLNRIIFWKL